MTDLQQSPEEEDRLRHYRRCLDTIWLEASDTRFEVFVTHVLDTYAEQSAGQRDELTGEMERWALSRIVGAAHMKRCPVEICRYWFAEMQRAGFCSCEERVSHSLVHAEQLRDGGDVDGARSLLKDLGASLEGDRAIQDDVRYDPLRRRVATALDDLPAADGGTA